VFCDANEQNLKVGLNESSLNEYQDSHKDEALNYHK
jgi:hypothetical protein